MPPKKDPKQEEAQKFAERYAQEGPSKEMAEWLMRITGEEEGMVVMRFGDEVRGKYVPPKKEKGGE